MTGSNFSRINLEPATKSLSDGTLGRQPGRPPRIPGASVKPQVLTNSQTKSRLKAIRNAQQQIAETIKEIQKKLKQVEKMPSSQPWITLKWASTVEELRSPHRSLKDALEHDIRSLKDQLRNLKLRKRIVIRQNAIGASKDFKKRLEDTLRKAENTGQLDDAELAALQKESLEVLNKFIDILDGDPSLENMEGVLSEMEIPMLLGADSESGRAMQSLGEVSSKLQDAAEITFRRNPKAANFEKFLHSRSLTQQLGGSDQPKRQGWKSVDTQHTVAPGETLSGISKQYYGNPAFWDLIYLENYGSIGDNARSLRIGVELSIP